MSEDASAKRARTMSEDAEPRRITQTLGADETHEMASLFAQWGLPPEFHRGIAKSWRCRLVPMARTEEEQRAHAVAGVPFLAPPELARGVFDAMRTPSTSTSTASGGGGGAPEASSPAPDAVSWACDSEWSSFPRPKVAMVGGWGAPGSHLLSERHMRMVTSFADVVDGDEPLNLQMFHRGADDVPSLVRNLRWPLPEFFSTAPHPSVESALKATLDPARPDATDADRPVNADGAPVDALPAQGASNVVGGVGVPLDEATRLSAAGALTWWHLDDCGEFVFQVGLPVDESRPRRATAKRETPRTLLGPTGRPVVKLFVFAEKEDYEWIAQDGVMNQTMKQSALDLFDTPDHYLPSEEELRPPYDATPLAGEGRYTGGGGGAGGGRDETGTEAETDADADAATPSGRKRPTFWVAPLEAGGCPLLSPPNVIHCVLTTRDCVMVEERRLSLLFLDEVHYFQNRAERWCEPPVQYRFLREDLTRPERCRVTAALPLLAAMRDARAALESAEETSARDAAAAAWARATASLELLASEPDRYALDETTRAEIRSATAAERTWASEGASEGARAAEKAASSDPRRARAAPLLNAMRVEGTKNVHRIGAFGVGGDGAPFCAVVHEKGRPRWGPARATAEEAAIDRKEMRRAVKDGDLDATLARWRAW